MEVWKWLLLKHAFWMKSLGFPPQSQSDPQTSSTAQCFGPAKGVEPSYTETLLSICEFPHADVKLTTPPLLYCYRDPGDHGVFLTDKPLGNVKECKQQSWNICWESNLQNNKALISPDTLTWDAFARTPLSNARHFSSGLGYSLTEIWAIAWAKSLKNERKNQLHTNCSQIRKKVHRGDFPFPTLCLAEIASCAPFCWSRNTTDPINLRSNLKINFWAWNILVFIFYTHFKKSAVPAIKKNMWMCMNHTNMKGYTDFLKSSLHAYKSATTKSTI